MGSNPYYNTRLYSIRFVQSVVWDTSASKFLCDECGSHFATRETLSQHLKSGKHSKICCSSCGKDFKTRDDLNKHYEAKHQQRVSCSSCGNSFKTRSDLDKHIKLKHTPKVSCSSCGKGFKSQDDLDQHFKLKHPPVPCSNCGKDFKTKDELDKHFEEKHSLKVPCSICSKDFKTVGDLDQHFRLKHAPNFFCSSCGKGFRTQDDLDQHLKSKHTHKFPCNKCGKYFDTQDSLDEHRLSNHGVSQFQCGCGEDFVNQQALDEHLKFWSKPTSGHPGEKINTNQEDLAGTSGGTNSVPEDLPRTREETNTDPEGPAGINEFRCKKCNTVFQSQQTLDRHHIAKHGNTEFYCNKCNRSFVSQHSLNEHLEFSAKHASEPHSKKPSTSDVAESQRKSQGGYSGRIVVIDGRLVYIKMYNSKGVSPVKLYCQDCARHFPDRYALFQHLVSSRHDVKVLQNMRGYLGDYNGQATIFPVGYQALEGRLFPFSLPLRIPLPSFFGDDGWKIDFFDQFIPHQYRNPPTDGPK